jgi:DNA-binding NtrC family response regulator
MMTRVMLVDGNRSHAENTVKVIGQIKPEWRCLVVDNCKDSRSLFSAFKPDAAVVKDGLKDGDAFDLLDDFTSMKPGLPVIVMAQNSPEYAAAKVRHNGALTLVPAQAPVGLLVLDLELALEKAKSAASPVSATQTAVSWKKPDALATLPSCRAIACYRPFDIFSLA